MESSSSGSDEELDRQSPPSREPSSESEEEVIPPTPLRADSPVGGGRVLSPLRKPTWKRRYTVREEEALKVVFRDYIRDKVEDVTLKVSQYDLERVLQGEREFKDILGHFESKVLAERLQREGRELPPISRLFDGGSAAEQRIKLRTASLASGQRFHFTIRIYNCCTYRKNTTIKIKNSRKHGPKMLEFFWRIYVHRGVLIYCPNIFIVPIYVLSGGNRCNSVSGSKPLEPGHVTAKSSSLVTGCLWSPIRG